MISTLTGPVKPRCIFEQGYASLENMHDGAHLFVALGFGNSNVACLELEESEEFYRQFGYALEEQRRLVAEYGVLMMED
jgi:hypothetical protein